MFLHFIHKADAVLWLCASQWFSIHRFLCCVIFVPGGQWNGFVFFVIVIIDKSFTGLALCFVYVSDLHRPESTSTSTYFVPGLEKNSVLEKFLGFLHF